MGRTRGARAIRDGRAHRADLVPGRRIACVTNSRHARSLFDRSYAGPAPTEPVKEKVMKKSLCVMEGVLFVALSFMPAILPTITFAQTDKSATQDVKDAGHSTKEAAKKTGHAVKTGTKKVVNKSAAKTGQGADKVADKTKP